MDLKLRLQTDPAFKELLRRLARGTVLWNETALTLKSNTESHTYVSGREDVTDDPQLGKLLGREIIRHARTYYGEDTNRTLCPIGIPSAGTALAAAASFAGGCSYRIMRETKKTHGAHTTWVNGAPDPSRHIYFTVDNVITRGTSVLEAIERLEEDGYQTHDMLHLVLIDRGQGGIERLRAAGYRAEAVFDLLDLVSAFGELGAWPEDRIQDVKREMQELRALA